MNHYTKALSFTLCLALLSITGNVGHAQQERITFDSGTSGKWLGSSLEYFIDSTKQMDLNSARVRRQWENGARQILGFGFSNDNYWLRLKFTVPKTMATEYVFNLDYAALSDVSFFLLKDGVIVNQTDMGGKSFSDRPLPFRAFNLPMGQLHGDYDLYLKVYPPRHTVEIPARIFTKKDF